MVGEVVVLQEWKNDRDTAIEAKYLFPLDEVKSKSLCTTKQILTTPSDVCNFWV
jgi:hypothetical protein